MYLVCGLDVAASLAWLMWTHAPSHSSFAEEVAVYIDTGPRKCLERCVARRTTSISVGQGLCNNYRAASVLTVEYNTECPVVQSTMPASLETPKLEFVSRCGNTTWDLFVLTTCVRVGGD